MDHSSERPEFIERLRAETRGLPYRPAKKKKPASTLDFEEARYLFHVATGERWMELARREPEPKMLFGEFWHLGEICILFADTNAGKSVLATQIADSIARAQPIGAFACEAPPQKVLYMDFELTSVQFFQRYGNPADPDGRGDYPFNANFMRAQFSPQHDVPSADPLYDDYLIAALVQKINLVKATVLIIDNITCLRGGTENAVVALRLMKNLKCLRLEHQLSILVLAHTPKRRNPARPLSADDLQGSKLLINFADSAFAIGKSTAQAGLCYLRQIKQRNTRQVYSPDNVCLCRITREAPANAKAVNFLRFEFEGHSAEQPHLQNRERYLGPQREELAKQVATLSANGLSQRQIAEQLQIGLGTVNKLMHV